MVDVGPRAPWPGLVMERGPTGFAQGSGDEPLSLATRLPRLLLALCGGQLRPQPLDA